MTRVNEIRSTFLDYFAARGHRIVPSAPLVPHDDPTLLFTNAGMVPFKNVFTGQEQRPYRRAASAQKCVRAGGKHNDLDNVGYTARHHTFFEMLGNFSFGDYFKDVAIELAWNLVTRDFGIAPERLLVTVFAADDEAFGLWRRIAGLPEERIIRIATTDNFWSMGETGPCGPCSEIFYDHGEGVPGGPPGTPEADGDRFVEIWNLVFMQYEQIEPGRRIDLPRPSIDTGMGIERIAAALQGVHDNYDIDLFRRLISASVAATGRPAEETERFSHRVIADHLRAVSFLIADGVLPANEGRGYVLRRIMRRAMRHAHLLGAQDPLMWRLVPVLVEEMGTAYPELGRAQHLIEETLRLEEERFRQTLERGLRLLDEEVARLRPGQALPGEVAFRLYDTYGFPLDLTEDVLRARGLRVDVAGFDAAMARQREEARRSWSGSGEQATEAIWFRILGERGPTEFLGHEREEAEGQVVALIAGAEEVTEAGEGAEIALIADQTPFYAESGGQVGDTGVITSHDGAVIEVHDTLKKAGALHVHLGRVRSGHIRLGDVVHLRIDAERRAAIRANHSATHLLHAALRRVLGPHVTQKGSLVAPDRLRFDFSHPRPLTAEEIAEIERQVNATIRRNSEVGTRLMAPEAAMAAGALALFGEKYGEEVRVLSMGVEEDRPYSVELCGGTHVRRTGDIALFKIVSESAVSAGVRRIEALTGEAARAYFAEQERLARMAAAALRTTPEELPERVAALIEERKRLERDLAEAKKRLAMAGSGAAAEGGGAGAAELREVAGVKIAARVFEGLPPKELRGLVDEAKRRLGSGVVAYVAVNDGKAGLVVGVTEDLTGRYSAVELARRGAEVLGGKGGGGRPDMAQAGGPDGAKAAAALEAIAGSLAELAGAA